jgi:hypothetical protein
VKPIYKEGDKTDYGNYRGILLISSSNILSNTLLSRLWPCIGEIIGDHHQCGLRRNRSTIDQIFCIRQILER